MSALFDLGTDAFAVLVSYRKAIAIVSLPIGLFAIYWLWRQLDRWRVRSFQRADSYPDHFDAERQDPDEYRQLRKSMRTRAWILISAAVLLFGLGVTSTLLTCCVNPAPLVLTAAKPLCDRIAATNLVIFVHGWDGDAAGTWRRFPELICTDPAFRDTEVVSVEYPSRMLRWNLNLGQIANWLNEQIKEERWQHYQRVAIVAHSLGGLIARDLLIALRLGEDRRSFGLLVEVGTPHQGTAVASLATALGVTPGLVQDAAPRARFLQDLEKRWAQMKTKPPTACYTSPDDRVVSMESATADCAHKIHHPQWNHRELVKPSRRDDLRYSMPMARVRQFFNAPNASRSQREALVQPASAATFATEMTTGYAFPVAIGPAGRGPRH